VGRLEYKTVVMTKFDRGNCQRDLARRIQLTDGDCAEAVVESSAERLSTPFQGGGSFLHVTVDLEDAVVRGQAARKDRPSLGTIQVDNTAHRQADGECTGNDGARAGAHYQVECRSNVKRSDPSLLRKGARETLQVSCGVQSPHSATIEAENSEGHAVLTLALLGAIADDTAGVSHRALGRCMLIILLQSLLH
jgi:hypothetical protein